MIKIFSFLPGKADLSVATRENSDEGTVLKTKHSRTFLPIISQRLKSIENLEVEVILTTASGGL